jgi:hypothetical protein
LGNRSGWTTVFSTAPIIAAAAQLGGAYWKGIYAPLADTLLGAQNADGSWPPEPQKGFARFGSAYASALAVLSLTPPYQLLPVYQR